MTPSAAPARALYVRYPRPATALDPRTGRSLGPVPGLIVLSAPDGLDPEVLVVEPGKPGVRLSAAGCDRSALCILELAAP